MHTPQTVEGSAARNPGAAGGGSHAGVRTLLLGFPRICCPALLSAYECNVRLLVLKSFSNRA